MTSLVNSQTSAVNFENYKIVLTVLNRISKLLYQLNIPVDEANFDKNQVEIKMLIMELLDSNLPLNEGNIATLEDTLITPGRYTKYKDIWALVGPNPHTSANPCIKQEDGSIGIGRKSLFSIDNNNPEDLIQNMPNKRYIEVYHNTFPNQYPQGRFSGYIIAVNSIKNKVIDFMKILPGGEEYLEANLNFSGGRSKRKIHKKQKSRKRSSKRKSKKKKHRKYKR